MPIPDVEKVPLAVPQPFWPQASPTPFYFWPNQTLDRPAIKLTLLYRTNHYNQQKLSATWVYSL